jgi:hypothetical protein
MNLSDHRISFKNARGEEKNTCPSQEQNRGPVRKPWLCEVENNVQIACNKWQLFTA